jgi:hypothetical protein
MYNLYVALNEELQAQRQASAPYAFAIERTKVNN